MLESEERCPRCALPRSQWTANGQGYPRNEQLYCCRGCAEEGACICLEAGAAGLPIVATRHAGIPDVVIQGETGFLVDEHDVDGMAQRMLRLGGHGPAV